MAQHGTTDDTATPTTPESRTAAPSPASSTPTPSDNGQASTAAVQAEKQKLPLDARSGVLLRRLIQTYVRPQAGRIAGAVGCMAIVAIATAAMTQLMKPIINDIFVNRSQEMLVPVALAALVVFAAKGIATYGQEVLMSHVGLRIVANIQSRLFRRLMEAEMAFFNAMSPGRLVARFVNDVQMLRTAVSTTLTGIGKDFLTLAALVGVMFYEDWLLALIAFFAFPTAVLPIVRIGKRVRKVSSNTQEQVGTLTTLLDETFQGARQVKAYSMERYEIGRAENAIENVFRLMLKNARTRNILHPVMETLGGLAIVTVILYGGAQVVSGAKDPGAFFAFITALLLAYEPMKRLAKLNANLQEGLAAAQRLFELMDREPTLVEAPDAVPLKIEGGAVELRDVEFSYSPDEEEKALHGLNLIAPAGKTVALVGASGAGKSTVLNLIPRFYDVTSGSVMVDGQDVRGLMVDSLRGAIALVSQETILFDDTVRANIAYGRLSASQEEIEAAAQAAGAHGFISQLPEGYDTLVGPRGARLSGGQRQRIAIARAMLKNAPILLLDEATSALDTESERHVQEALKTLMAGRTTLVIAHRLSTVIDADVIYVFERGRVVEQGSHAELLARGGAYARLYSLQFADQPVSAESTAGDSTPAGAKQPLRA